MVNINITRKNLILLVIVLVLATIINYTIAQVPSGSQGHGLAELFISEGNTLDDNPADNLIDVADIKQGSGSGLDADTVDGLDSTELGGGGGEFNVVEIDCGLQLPTFTCRDAAACGATKCAAALRRGTYGDKVMACTTTCGDMGAYILACMCRP